MSKHTPSPWAIRISESEIDIIGPYQSNKDICILKNSGNQEDISNTHLIRCAPELLAALKAIVEAEEIDLYVGDEWDNAKIAIIKAERI